MNYLKKLAGVEPSDHPQGLEGSLRDSLEGLLECGHLLRASHTSDRNTRGP